MSQRRAAQSLAESAAAIGAAVRERKPPSTRALKRFIRDLRAEVTGPAFLRGVVRGCAAIRPKAWGKAWSLPAAEWTAQARRQQATVAELNGRRPPDYGLRERDEPVLLGPAPEPRYVGCGCFGCRNQTGVCAGDPVR